MTCRSCRRDSFSESTSGIQILNYVCKNTCGRWTQSTHRDNLSRCSGWAAMAPSRSTRSVSARAVECKQQPSVKCVAVGLWSARAVECKQHSESSVQSSLMLMIADSCICWLFCCMLGCANMLDLRKQATTALDNGRSTSASQP